ncbi:lipoprotein BA_5634 family protein [Bacillus cereus]|uniref:lipoprotein BA_5634 family protein n=1 Tax=Bacillus cereus TaxID=1396 RepID=UPI000C292140|nr:lipoprotein BA_5634 family protein [Bacillus cereus]
MKKWLVTAGIIMILGGGFLSYYHKIIPFISSRAANSLLITGNEEEVKSVLNSTESSLSSYALYKEKFDRETRVLSKTDAEKLVNMHALQAVKDKSITEPISSLPEITPEQGIVYQNDKQPVQKVEIGGKTLNVKAEGDVVIGAGPIQKKQSMLIIVDDSVYENLDIKELTSVILKFTPKSVSKGDLQAWRNNAKEEAYMLRLD